LTAIERYLKERARFWTHVHRTDGCWLWTAATNSDGYGLWHIAGKTVQAHRASYAYTKGPIPKGLHVLHSCDNPTCVNPAHLSLGTNQTNVDDSVSKGRNCRGTRNGNSKLTEDQVRQIRARYAAGESYPDLGIAFGVTSVLIGQIVRNKIWKHVNPA